MSIKTVLPFFSVHVLTLFCIITPISGILDLYCIMENFKKNREKNNSKLRVMCPKNHEHFKNIKSSSNFIGSYKKTVYQACILHYGKIVAYILAYVLVVFTYHLKRLWLLLRPLFAIGKH